MIPHHSQAVYMATMVLERSSNPAIVDLAIRIQGAQDPEIEKMRSWLEMQGQQEMSPDMDDMDDMGHGSAEGMMDDTELAALSTAAGTEFDALSST